jgi:hypothetical protein
MAAIELPWQIVITCGTNEVGEPVPCRGWDVLSRLAAVRGAIPATWMAEAFPVLRSAK